MPSPPPPPSREPPGPRRGAVGDRGRAARPVATPVGLVAARARRGGAPLLAPGRPRATRQAVVRMAGRRRVLRHRAGLGVCFQLVRRGRADPGRGALPGGGGRLHPAGPGPGARVRRCVHAGRSAPPDLAFRRAPTRGRLPRAGGRPPGAVGPAGRSPGDHRRGLRRGGRSGHLGDSPEGTGEPGTRSIARQAGRRPRRPARRRGGGRGGGRRGRPGPRAAGGPRPGRRAARGQPGGRGAGHRVPGSAGRHLARRRLGRRARRLARGRGGARPAPGGSPRRQRWRDWRGGSGPPCRSARPSRGRRRRRSATRSWSGDPRRGSCRSRRSTVCLRRVRTRPCLLRPLRQPRRRPRRRRTRDGDRAGAHARRPARADGLLRGLLRQPVAPLRPRRASSSSSRPTPLRTAARRCPPRSSQRRRSKPSRPARPRAGRPHGLHRRGHPTRGGGPPQRARSPPDRHGDRRAAPRHDAL